MLNRPEQGLYRITVVVLALLGLAQAVARAQTTNDFLGVVTPIPGWYSVNSGVGGLAQDAAGNIYSSDIATGCVYEYSVASNYYPVELSCGFSAPQGLAVDPSGNVIVADYNNSRVVVLPVGGGAAYDLADNVYEAGSVAVDAAGNAYVTSGNTVAFFHAPLHANEGYGSFSNFRNAGALALWGIAVSADGSTLYAGDIGNDVVYRASLSTSTATLLTYALPYQLVLDAQGNLFIAGGLIGGSSGWTNGGFTALEIPAANLGQTYSQIRLAQKLVGYGASSYVYGLAIDSSGNMLESGGAPGGNIQRVQLNSANFGSTTACSSGQKSGPCQLRLAFALQTPVPSVHFVVSGAASPDFIQVGQPSCTTTSVLYGEFCEITVEFTPSAPGLREADMQVADSQSGSVLASVPLYGLNVAPQVAFDLPVPITVGSGLSSPVAVAVDSVGNVFVADSSLSHVVELPVGGGSAINLGAGLSQPSGVAVDAGGDVFIADATNNNVVKVPGGGGAQTTVATGLSGPQGMAVDGVGNIYIADTNNNRVLEVTPLGVQIPIGSGLSSPAGVAIDAAGNLFIADSGNHRVVEEPVNGGAQKVALTGLTVSGVTVDAADNLYVSNTYLKTVVLYPSAGGTQVSMRGNLSLPVGMAVDGAGDVYVAESGNGTVLELQRSQPPSFNFSPTPLGQTSVESPASFRITNVGNAALNFPVPSSGTNPSVPANFTLGGGASNCPVVASSATSAATLASGAYCQLNVSFTPTTYAAYGGDVVFTDNALNGNPATQSIPLQVPAQQTQTITFPTLTPPFIPGSTYTLNATASSGLPITYVTTGEASVTGSTLTILGTGSFTVYAEQPGSEYYAPATTVSQTLTAQNAHSTDYFAGGVKPIPNTAQAFSGLGGVALDAAGNIYTSDVQNGCVYKFVKASAYAPTQLTCMFRSPQGLTVDSSGNVIVADYGNSEVVVLPAGGGTPYVLDSSVPLAGSVAVDAAGDVFVTSNADVYRFVAPLHASESPTIFQNFEAHGYALWGIAVSPDGSTMYVSDVGNRQVLESAVVPAPSAITVLASGGITPAGLALDKQGNLYVAGIFQSTAFGLVEIMAGGVGPGRGVTGNFKYLGAYSGGTYGVAIDSAGNIFEAGESYFNGASVEQVSPNAVSFGSPGHCTNSSSSGACTATMYYLLSSPISSSSSISFSSGGVADSDFSLSSAPLCGADTFYPGVANQFCSFNVKFAPTLPGARSAVMEMTEANGTTIPVAVYGTGVAPEIAFDPQLPTSLGSGWNTPESVAVDSIGNVFVADKNLSQVVELPTGGGAAVNIGTGLSHPSGVALDAAGDVFIADAGNNNVVEVPAGGGAQTTVATGLSSPQGLAADAAGDVYIADTGNNRVLEVTNLGAQISVGSGLNSPAGVAIDATGNLFIGDTGNGRIVEEPASGGAQTVPVPAATGNALAVDAADNLYVSNTTAGTVTMFPASGVAPIAVQAALAQPAGLAVDAAGDVFVADSGNGKVVELPRSLPPTLDFSPTALGQTSVESPTALEVTNVGNAALSFFVPSSGTNPSVPANFSLGGGTCAVTASGATSAATLASGNTCQLDVSFAPTAYAAYGGNVTFTDNALNGNPATQSVLVLVPAQQSQTITFPALTGPFLNGSTYALSATASSGLPITYATTGVASVTGSTLSILGAGSFSVSAEQTGNEFYAPATTVSQSLTAQNPTSGGEGARIQVTPGTVNAVSGQGSTYCEGCVASSAQLGTPQDVAVDSSGNVYFTDSSTKTVRTIHASTGVISTIAGVVPGNVGADVSTNRLHRTAQQRAAHIANPAATNRIAASARVQANRADAITPAALGTSVTLSDPYGIAVDSVGDVFFADADQDVVYKVTPDGNMAIVAGTYNVSDYGGDGGPATSAWLSYPLGVALDPAGNLYIADADNAVIRKVDTSGNISTIAGIAGSYGDTGDGGAATSAQLSYPIGVTVDPAGNVYLADNDYCVVRKVDTSGNISTIAGGTNQSTQCTSYSGDGGSASSAILSDPVLLHSDAGGSLYIADGTAVRKIDTHGVIRDVAGIEERSETKYVGGGYPATAVDLGYLDGAGVDAAGNIYAALSDYSYLVSIPSSTAVNFSPVTSSVEAQQVITISNVGTTALTFTGNPTVSGAQFSYEPRSPYGCDFANSLAPGGSCDLDITFSSSSLGSFTGTLTIHGNGTNAPLAIGLNGSAVGPHSFVSLTPSTNTLVANTPLTLTAVASPDKAGDPTPTGSFQLFNGTALLGTANLDNTGTAVFSENALSAGAYAFTAQYSGDANYSPSTSTVVNVGVYPAGSGSPTALVQVAPGLLSVVSGEGSTYCEGCPAINASLNEPQDIVLDSSGNIYFSDSGLSAVRKISAATGDITTIAGTANSGDAIPQAGQLRTAQQRAAHRANPSAANAMAKAARAKVTAALKQPYRPNALGTSTSLPEPFGMAVDSGGNVYFAEGESSAVYKIAPDDTLTVVAGTPYQSDYGGDGGPATSAWLSHPVGVALDAAGNLYIADSENEIIRKVDTSGNISTVAGKPGSYGNSGDGGPATAARLGYPLGVAVDSFGNLYITDDDYCVLRKVDTTGMISTVAGVAGNYCNDANGDEGPAVQAHLIDPIFIHSDAAGALYLADGSAVRKIDTNGVIRDVAGIESSSYNGLTGAGGEATTADLGSVNAAAVDSQGNIFVTLGNYSRLVKAGPAAPIAFGLQQLSSTTTQTVTVSNFGLVPLTFSGTPVLSGAGFTFAPLAPYGCNFSGSVLPGSSCDISITFTPTTVGPYSGTLTITENDPNSPLVLNLTGSGAHPPAALTLTAPSSITATNPLALTAVAAPGISGGPTPTGTFQLLNNGSVIDSGTLDGTGTVHFTEANLAQGSYSFTAQYSGDFNYSSGTSSPVAVTVNPATATLVLNASPTALLSGQTVNASVAVSGNGLIAPTGSVTFLLNGVAQATSPIASGTASASFAVANRGNLTAAYGGDSNYAAATSNAVPLTLSGGVLQFVPAQATNFAGVPGTDNNGSFSGNGGPAINARMHWPYGVAIDSSGNVYISDQQNNQVRRVGVNGNISGYAGAAHTQSVYTCYFAGDNGNALNAEFCNPAGITFDSHDNLYIADYGNNAVRRVDAVTGVITTVAGKPQQGGYNGDGVGTQTYLSHPIDVKADASGNIYIADYGNNLVRKLDTSGNMTTVAGSYYAYGGTSGQNGVSATSVALTSPTAVALDASGNLYIAEGTSGAGALVRKVTNGIINTVAGGQGFVANDGDGLLATQASLSSPYGLAIDAVGTLYISDLGHATVRRVDPATQMITTIVGSSGSFAYNVDPGGLPATDSALTEPEGLAVDGNGALYVVNSFNENVIKVGEPGSMLFANAAPGTTTSAPQNLQLSNTGNQPITFSSTPYTVTGNFTVTAGGTGLCNFTTPLAVGASCNVTVQYTPPVGAINLQGSLAFNDNAIGGPQLVHLQVNANPTATTTQLNIYSSPSVAGTEVDLFATVNPSVTTVNPGGSVAFYDGATLIGTAPYTGQYGDLAVTTFAPGTHSITAVYSGDMNYASSTSPAGTLVITGSTTGPVLTLPSNIVAEATSASGSVVPFIATATDTTDGTDPVTCVPASGSTFPLGTTTVNCSATDTGGNVANGSFTITVRDTTAPVLTLPSNIVAEAVNASGAVVTFSASATDSVDGTDPVTCTPASGSTFPLGITTVNCSATDKAGNVAPGSFTVTVRETTSPLLTLPSNIVAEATSPGGAVVAFSASATDTVDGTDPVTCVPPSGSTFSLGVTTVNCSAADRAGNVGTGSFTVTVRDTSPPTLTLPSNIVAEAVSIGGAVVAFSPTATDTADGSLPVTCIPASGSTFPLGATTVHCSATDLAGNVTTGSFTVTVLDTTPPTLTLPSNITAEAVSVNGAVVAFSATATDTADGSLPVTCIPASGSTFPLGATTVHCSATDLAGNVTTGSFTVTVRDTSPPTLTLPSNITAEAVSVNGAVVAFSATATDTADGTLPVTCTPASGSYFPLGVTTVHCAATDLAGNVTTGSFTVTVRDTSPPTLTLPSNIVVTATGPSGAIVTFNATATDTADGSLPVTCVPPSGSNFLIGTTTVNCSATDTADNVTTGSFTVTVIAGVPVLTVTATSVSRTYGAANPGFGYSVTGFVNGDTVSILTGAPSFTTTAVGTSPQGIYPITITQGTLAAAGYTLQFVNGTLTVSGLSPQKIAFGIIPNLPVGTTMTLTARSTSGLPVTYSVSGPANLAGDKLTPTAPGPITVTANQAGNSNYTAALPVPRSFTAQ